MGEAAMVLGDEELKKIGDYVKAHLVEWLPESQGPVSRSNRELDIIERIVRVEEEIKNLGTRMDKRFEAVDKRFEAVDKRFETVDKRFETMQTQMDRRFDAVDKRFESMESRFNRMTALMTAGFAFLAILISVYQFLT